PFADLGEAIAHQLHDWGRRDAAGHHLAHVVQARELHARGEGGLRVVPGDLQGAAHLALSLPLRIICVQRKRAIVLPDFSDFTSASQTWVVRPLCTGVAMQVTSPSSVVPKKLLFSSIVVKPSASAGRLLTVA